MGRQIKLLTKISLCSRFRLNEFRYTNDRGLKRRYLFMGLLVAVLILMAVAYVCGLSYGLIVMQMGDLVPAVLTLIVSVAVFLYTVFQAGPLLFELHTYENQITLPVTVRAIIISRFLSMYIISMLAGMGVMVPGLAVYGVMEHPGVTFYLYGLISMIFVPLVPLTAASITGVVITGISSRWKRSGLVATGLALCAICLVFLVSFWLSGRDEQQLMDLVQQMASLLERQIQRLYPPALWISQALVQGNIRMLALFLLVSAGGFIFFLELLQHFYEKICSLLGSYFAKGNYRMKRLSARGILYSMVQREMRHYFSSTVYVTNTLAGEVLMVFLAVAVLVSGSDSIEQMTGMPGLLERVLPVILGMLPAMMPLSACSVSMEGTQWWMMQTLPVSVRDIVYSKALTSIIIALPFYLVSEILLLVALKPDLPGAVCLIVVPVVYIVYVSVLGVAVNLKFPVMEWESEVRVVKQSASVFVMSVTGIISGMVPAGILIYFRNSPAYIIYGALLCLLTGVTWVIMTQICRNNRYMDFAIRGR